MKQAVAAIVAVALAIAALSMAAAGPATTVIATAAPKAALAPTATTTPATTSTSTTSTTVAAAMPADPIQAPSIAAAIDAEPTAWPDIADTLPYSTVPELTPGLDASIDELRSYVAGRAEAEHGWTGEQWEALDWLINRESTWNPTADNPRSTAFGLGQFLASTARAYGMDHPDLNKRTPTVEAQITAMFAYIVDRYDTPIGAKQFWLAQCGGRYGCFY